MGDSVKIPLPGILRRFMDATDHTADVKLASFAAVVVASIVWLSLVLPKGINPEWIQAYYGLCALVGLGGSTWAAVERWKGLPNQTPPPAPAEPGAPATPTPEAKPDAPPAIKANDEEPIP